MDAGLKLLIGGTLVFALLFGGFFWWLNTPSGVPIAQEPSSSGSQNNVPSDSNTTGVSVPRPNNAEPIAYPVPDIYAKYDALYARLNASRVQFESLAPNGPYKSVYALYKADVDAYAKEFPEARNSPLLMALVDVDGDGVDEVVVYQDMPGFCGPENCTLEVLKLNGGAWKIILSAEAYKQLGVSYVVENGYAVFFLAAQGEITYESKVVRYAARSGMYEPEAEVAYWDGAAFKTPRVR